jgi:hypothetical protein
MLPPEWTKAACSAWDMQGGSSLLEVNLLNLSRSEAKHESMSAFERSLRALHYAGGN